MVSTGRMPVMCWLYLLHVLLSTGISSGHQRQWVCLLSEVCSARPQRGAGPLVLPETGGELLHILLAHPRQCGGTVGALHLLAISTLTLYSHFFSALHQGEWVMEESRSVADFRLAMVHYIQYVTTKLQWWGTIAVYLLHLIAVLNWCSSRPFVWNKCEGTIARLIPQNALHRHSRKI